MDERKDKIITLSDEQLLEISKKQQEKNRIITDKEIIEISKKNPSSIYHHPDGRIAHNGFIFKNEQELKEYLKAYVNITDAVLKFLRPFRFIKNLFSKKK